MIEITEDIILRNIVNYRRGIPLSPIVNQMISQGIDLDRELAKLYMPEVAPDISDDDLLIWGKKFKEIVEQKVAEKTAEIDAEIASANKGL